MTAHLTLEDVYRPLVEGLAGIRLDTAPVMLPVRCGIDKGSGKKCDAPIGCVVSTPRGPAWLPAVTSESAVAPGGVPMLLPTTTPEQRRGFCEVLTADCAAGHLWALASAELLSRARQRGTAPYYPLRVVPTEWGPVVEDPDLWTDQELSEAVATLARIATGQWPGDSDLSGIARSKAEARAHRLSREIAGPSVATEEEHARLVDRLAALLGSVPDAEHNA